ncbi:MAG: ribonuclease III [Actinomycetes bacterium]|jgi:ribonuclease-3
MRELVARLGVELSEEILKQAITHRSFSYENGGVPTNERLEFLGDSVLGIVITDELYRKNPDAQEGQLAKLRAAVVNAKALADVARTLGLGEFLLLGKGEEATGGRDKSSILADAVEAILGAIYVEHGLAKSGEVILQLFAPILAASAELGAGLDWKTSLAELVNSKSLGAIEYVIEQSGPDHDKRFSAQVKVGQDLYGNGEGKSKKEAEQHAAASAYTEINNLRP